jgi:vancomycin permeability regulator SanA
MMTILIFGAAVLPGGKPSTTLRRRVEAALAAARHHPDALFVPTGAIGRHGPSEASVMAGLLRESGVASDRILLEESGTDTFSSVRAIGRLWREKRIHGHVMVATSAYHMPRCLILLCLFGMAARPCPAPRESGGGQWYWWLREIPAIPCDAALALWARLTGRL